MVRVEKIVSYDMVSNPGFGGAIFGEPKLKRHRRMSKIKTIYDSFLCKPKVWIAGNHNIAIGYSSMYANTTGSYNVAIGSAWSHHHRKAVRKEKIKNIFSLISPESF